MVGIIAGVASFLSRAYASFLRMNFPAIDIWQARTAPKACFPLGQRSTIRFQLRMF